MAGRTHLRKYACKYERPQMYVRAATPKHTRAGSKRQRAHTHRCPSIVCVEKYDRPRNVRGATPMLAQALKRQHAYTHIPARDMRGGVSGRPQQRHSHAAHTDNGNADTMQHHSARHAQEAGHARE
ncbi:unnamed protein product [Trichogramma brassicae]|uniref:Uncharacterized protein n=1 Tax=Trichogramma brassicae TaxID=86971 RepID=A0A6H5HUK4_9HYME|nr:unnamed protein product [Trichogramma brassicae]